MQELLHQLCFVNGAWIAAYNKAVLEVNNPFDGSILGVVPNFGAQETREAIDAASRALPLWRSKTAKERAEILLRWYQLILQAEEVLARLLTLEQGKPITEARTEIRYGASFVQWFAEEAKRAYGDIIPNTLA